MKELNDAVTAAFANVVASGAIEKAIEKQIGDAVTSAIRDELASYGDFGKAIKEKVAQLIQINVAEIDMPSYSDLVVKIIRARVDASMQSQFAAQLEKDIGELLAPAPAEITLEQLINDFIEAKKDYAGDLLHGRDFTLIITDDDHGYHSIYIDKNERTDKYQCDIQIRTNKAGEVYSLRFGGNDVKDQLFVGPLWDFEKSLFQLYTAKSKLIIPEGADASDYPTRFPYPGEDD